jgi:hypothetical protein
LQQNNPTTAKADKSKAIVIIDKNELKHKIDAFIQENKITGLNKDPTELYQKQIQQAIQICNVLIDKNTRKYLTNIKPIAPKINAYIKRNKENEPIRPVIDNTQAPSYKIARFLNNRLKDYINLPGTYTTKTSHETAQELHNIHIRENHKIITLDIKDLYVNLPTKVSFKSQDFG